MRGTLIAAGGAAFAAAALVGGLAGPATADIEDRHRSHGCDMQTKEVKTWMDIHGHKISLGTRHASACKGDGRPHGHDYGSWALNYALDGESWRLDD
jgi:hypothetical protein